VYRLGGGEFVVRCREAHRDNWSPDLRLNIRDLLVRW